MSPTGQLETCWIYLCYMGGTLETLAIKPPSSSFPTPLIQMLWLPPLCPSQRSLHSAPIFRLLLKVALDWTHQCDFHNFWGALSSNCIPSIHATLIQLWLPHPTHCKHMRKCYGRCPTPLSQSILAEGAIALSMILTNFTRHCTPHQSLPHWLTVGNE